MIFLFFKQCGLLGILGPLGNHASPRIRNLSSKGGSQIFCIFLDVFEFLRFGWLFPFSNYLGFCVFLVHPETTLPHGLETSGRWVYRKFLHISRRFWVFAFWIIFCLFLVWVFLDHPTVVSVVLSASVERCFVSRIRDFWYTITSSYVKIITDLYILSRFTSCRHYVQLAVVQWNKRCITSRQRQCNQLWRANPTDKYATSEAPSWRQGASLASIFVSWIFKAQLITGLCQLLMIH